MSWKSLLPYNEDKGKKTWIPSNDLKNLHKLKITDESHFGITDEENI